MFGAIQQLRNATMGGWGLKLYYKALQKNKGGWGFILYKSYVTSTNFKLCTF